MKKSSGVIGSIDLAKGPIAIYGGGICGLLFGYYLKQRNIDFKIFEKENRIGGKIATHKLKNGIVETAANALFTSPDLLSLVNELELSYLNPKPELKKLIYRNGKARSFPLRLLELLSIILKLHKKIPSKRFDLSIREFFLPLLGERVCDEVLTCIFNGIYATPIKELHFKSVFTKNIKAKTYFGFFLELKQNKPKGFKAKSISFKNGLQDVINRLEEELKDNIIKNSTKKLSPTENNIICTDAINASLLLKDSHPSYSNLLKKIKYTRLNTTTVFTKNKLDYLESSFGILYPYSDDQALGILNNTAIFDHRSEDNQVKSYTIISKSKDYKLENTSIEEYEQIVWEKALPVYNFSRYNTIKQLRVESFNYSQTTAIYGNYVDGISIREMLTNIKDFCEKLK